MALHSIPMLNMRLATVAVLAAGTLVLPAPASASRSHKVDVTATARISGSGLAVSMTGKPVGTCKGTATVNSKGAIFNSKCKHGKLRVRITFKKGDQSRGTWRVLSGTGRYKGSSGKGRYVGSITSLKFRMSGTARY